MSTYYNMGSCYGILNYILENFFRNYQVNQWRWPHWPPTGFFYGHFDSFWNRLVPLWSIVYLTHIIIYVRWKLRDSHLFMGDKSSCEGVIFNLRFKTLINSSFFATIILLSVFFNWKKHGCISRFFKTSEPELNLKTNYFIITWKFWHCK